MPKHLSVDRGGAPICAALVWFLLGFQGSAAAQVSAGPVFSTAQTASQSFLRFFNTGAKAGTVSVVVRDYSTGQSLGQWTSDSVSVNSEKQYTISEIENALGLTGARPQYYSISIRSNINGYFQHVLWRPADGTLTNLSTCDSGTGANRTKISAVHSSLLQANFPSTVVVNNTRNVARTATLGVYDARDGTKRGSYTTPTIPANGQLSISTPTLEAAIGAPTAGMFHYVVKAEGGFPGFLQSLVDNTKVSVTADMTAGCLLKPAAAASPKSSLAAAAIYSSAQPAAQSFLRFHNAGIAAGAVTVTLRDYVTGQSLGQWATPSIPPNAEKQFAISTIEAALGIVNRPPYYAAWVNSDINGSFQHVLWRPADGTLTNLSTCSNGVSTNAIAISGVHSSLLQSGFPSTVIVNNTGPVAAAATLAVYDADSGTKLGAYTTLSIPANGQLLLSVPAIESVIGAPTGNNYHYVIRVEGEFTGFLQHLVNNVQVSVTTDMTTSCALGASKPAVPLTFVSNGRLGRSCSTGQTSTDGPLTICGSNGRFRYALQSDIPETPLGGYNARPAWYPPIADAFRATNPPACPASGRVTLPNFIYTLDQLSYTEPSGKMISDHVLPSDHAYVTSKAQPKPQSQLTEADYIPVYAPGDGEIVEISLVGSPTSIRVVIAHGCDTYSVIITMNRLAGVLASYNAELQSKGRVSSHVQVLAGQQIGSHALSTIDFAIHDGSTWLAGIESPFSWAENEQWKPYTVDVLPYFPSEIAAAIDTSLQRKVPPHWGTLEVDAVGAAAGDWYLDGTAGYSGYPYSLLATATTTVSGGPPPGKKTFAWSHLAIARHWISPNNWVFSTGWWKDPAGDPTQLLLEVAGGLPEPSELTPDAGIVVYRLLNLSLFSDPRGLGGTAQGIVALQVNEDGTLFVEPIPTETDPTKFTGFSAAVRTYRR